MFRFWFSFLPAKKKEKEKKKKKQDAHDSVLKDDLWKKLLTVTLLQYYRPFETKTIFDIVHFTTRA